MVFCWGVVFVVGGSLLFGRQFFTGGSLLLSGSLFVGRSEKPMRRDAIGVDMLN